MSDYERPETLAAAVGLLAREDRTVLAGGTDLYPATSAQVLPRPVLDITGVAELRGIEPGQDAIRIGACVTWSQVLAARLPPAFDALKQAAAEVGGRQIQNAATVAGNLCNASPAADGVPPLLVLDAEVELVSATGPRRMPLAAFLTGPRQTALRRDEILAAVLVPARAMRGQSAFLKLGARSHLVISIAMVATRLVVADGRVAEAALAVGACGPVAVRLPEAEAGLVGASVRGGLGEALDGKAVAARLSPIDDVRGSAAYRIEAAVELLRRAVSRAGTAA